MSDELEYGSGIVSVDGDPIELSFAVPSAVCSPRALLPDVQQFANRLVDSRIRMVEAEGHSISCKKGCGACCRQMVPVGPDEARHIADLVDAMPPVRQAVVRQRFAEAVHRLETSGLSLEGVGPQADQAKYRETVLGYFHLGIPCPFLEDESCSIHPDRPLVCREYVVTSDPAFCATLGSGTVHQVSMPIRVWNVYARSIDENHQLPWTALIYALEFAKNKPEPPSSRTGPEHAQRFLQVLADA